MMVDEQAKSAEIAPQQSITPIGEVLWAAREAKKLTVQDASNYLRFSVKQIVALEANAFSELPDATITRGFIRNYARYLGLDAEPLLASYRARVPQLVHESLYVKSDLHQVVSSVDNRPWLKYILGSILALLFLVAWLLYLEFMPKSRQTATAPTSKAVVITPAPLESATQQVMPLPELVPIEAVLEGAGDDVPTPSLDSQAPPSQLTSIRTPRISEQVAPNANKPNANANKPNANNRQDSKKNADLVPSPLILHGSAFFSEQTWMQVKDKTGKVVFESLSPANSVANFSGTPPFDVLIGNAKATTLKFLDKNVDITTQAKNNVARVRLE